MTTNAGNDVEKRKPFYTVCGIIKWYSHLEVSEETKNRTTILTRNLISGYISKGSKAIFCTPMFIAALLRFLLSPWY